MSKYPGRIVTDLAPAGYSVFFDGSGDWLETPNNSTLALGSSDFSVEWWEYRTTLAAEDTAIQAAGTYGFYFNYYDTGFPRFFLSTSSGSWNVFNNAATGAISANTWNHFVVTRSGTAFRVFLNGVLSIYATGSGSVVQPNNNFLISGNAAQSYFPGYISNVRVVKGSIPTPYQTSSTTTNTTVFTPPTQVLNSTDTILLTCNSPAIIDQSNNAFAITVNGNSAVSTFTPFTAYVPYNPALGASTPGVWTLDEALQAKGTRQWNMYDPSFNLTTLLLHGNGTNAAQNNTFLDSSSNNFTITRNGNTTQGSFSPFSQTGWSYFGATSSDKLTASSTSPANFGSGAFTIEAWVYFNDTGASGQRVIAANYQNSTTGWLFWRNNVGGGAMQFHGSGDGADITGTTIMAPGRWYHVAVSGTPTSPGIRLFVNGVQEGSTYTGAVSLDSTNPVVIGDGAGGAAGYGLNGYISNFRLLKGTALYTTNFTPPTTPLTNITNTSLLTCQSNRFVDNGTANSGSGYTFTVGGNPSVQPFSPFYPTAAYTPATVGGSGYFDGTGDYLETPSFSVDFSVFSMEFWINTTSTTANQTFINRGGSTWSITTVFNIYMSGTTTGYVTLLNGTGGVNLSARTTTRVNDGAWHHVLFTYDGTTYRVFQDGVLEGTQTAASMGSDSRVMYMMYDPRNVRFGTGYLSNFRLITGSGNIPSAYQTSSTTLGTQIFTVPTQPIRNETGTNLLLNFTNAGIVDSTAKNVLETVGNAQISTTQSKFGGSSMYFDGTGDYLQTAPSQLFNVGASDFTIEFWIYPTSFAATSYPIYSASARAKADCIALETNTSGVINAYVTASGGAAWSIVAAGNVGTLTLNTWNHVALVRNGSAFRGYVNGVQGGMTTSSSSAVASFDGWNIGFNGASAYFTGYMDDIRITRFARYTGNFTPQTSQWQDE